MKSLCVRLAVVSGFKPFGDYKGNASARIAMKLHDSQIEGIKVVGVVLENTYDSHEILMQKIRDAKRSCGLAGDEPVVVVGGGLSSSIHQVSLEAVGYNEINSRYADATGALIDDNRPVVPNAPNAYRTNADLVAVSMDLARAGVPTRISTDPGRFTCNSLLFGLQHLIVQEGLAVLFVYYHTGVQKGDIEGELPPLKIYHPTAWLEDGVPAMVKTAARQARRMLRNKEWVHPVAVDICHIETMYLLK